MTYFRFRRPQSYLRNSWSKSRQILHASRIYQTVALWWQTTSNRHGRGHVTRFLEFCPNHIFGVGETRHFKCRVLIDTKVCWCTHDRLPPKGMCSESRDLFKFWEISDNISETVLDTWLQWKSNRKSYLAYRMAPLSVPLNDLECYFCCLKHFIILIPRKHSTNLLT